MIRLRTAALTTFALALWGCGQEIVVVQCDGHDQERDGGTNPGQDARPPGADAGGPEDRGPAGDTGSQDTGLLDTGTPDGGQDPCAAGRYCLRSLTASSERVNVRESVTLTPVIDNPSRTALTFSVRPLEIGSERKQGRPPLVLREVTIDLSVNPQSGVATFVVNSVPPWFLATTFLVRVYAKGPAVSDPEVFAEARVHVRGNVAFSAYGADYAVYTVASDGRPSRAVTPGSMRGELVTSVAVQPRALLLAKNGTLLVYDHGVTPPRILRLELTGENVQIGAFEHSDAQMMPYLSESNAYPYSLAELPDGRIVTSDYETTRTPKSRLVLWNADGSFSRFMNPVDPQEVWSGVSVRENGELLVVVREGTNGRVLRIDAMTGQVITPALADTRAWPRVVLGVPGGDAYVGTDGAVFRVSMGGTKIRISTLPTTEFTYWRSLAPFDSGRILTSNDTSSSDSTNIAIIEGRDFVSWLRPTNVGGTSGSVYGLAYLE
jgi:hypothetical protein